MATTISTTTTTTLLLLLTITTAFTATVHGRESQFFAKVSNNIPQETQPSNTHQQDSTNADSYGLYGHETGQLPPAATSATNNRPANLPDNYNPVAYTTPIHSNTQDLPNDFDEPQAFPYNADTDTYNSAKQETGANGGDAYNSEKQGLGTNGGDNAYDPSKEGAMFVESTGNGGETYNSVKQENGRYNNEGQGMYNSQKQGMSDTRFLEKGRYFYGGDNAYNPSKQGAMFAESTGNGGETYNSVKQENGRYNNEGQEMYNSQKQGNGRYNNQGAEMYNYRKSGGENGNMYNNNERQGMSDTRFLENGKYYYDLNSESLNANANMNTRGFEYNNKGYYGNNDVGSYERYNSNGGYQNQEEFQESQDDQFNP